ncbi:MAG: glycoside hydrolase family 9 protein [Cytophagaceae bacterium]
MNPAKNFPLFLFFLILSFQTIAGRYVRYNYAGYEPERNKVLFILSDDNCINTPWEIKDLSGSITLKGTIGKSISGSGDHSPKFFNHAIDFSELRKEGEYTFEIKGIEPFKIKITNDPYSTHISEVLRFLKSQRCGSNDAIDHAYCHEGDKECSIYRRNKGSNKDWIEDVSGKKVNMSGGWHDAGDYIKFTLTTSYTTYFLLRSYEAAPSLFAKKKTGGKDNADILDEAKWGLDYLMKCMPDTSEFIIQAGGWLDHEKGLRLPDTDVLDGKREAYSALSPTQMGYTAAALALGAKIFSENGKSKEAKAYADMAKKIFRVAIKNDKDNHCAWFEKDFQFYADNSPNDNLALAAAELYILTKDEYFLEKANYYSEKAGAAYWAAWPSCNMIVHLRLLPYNNSLKRHVETDLEQFYSISTEENNIWGMPHKYTWATLYSAFLVANAAKLYQKQTESTKYNKIPYDVLDYTFGRNNWGVAMLASKNLPNSIRNVYSQVYKLQPNLFPTGAIAEGPGDKQTHSNLIKYFNISESDPYHRFNTKAVVFFDNNTDFQSMETTITGLADGIFMLSLAYGR